MAATTPQQTEALCNNIAGVFSQPKVRAALQEGVDRIQAQLGQTFENETEPDGTPWPKWHFRDLTQSASGKKTLQFTGRLLSSIVNDVADHIESVGDDFAEMGTSVEYASKHQEGGISVVESSLVSRDGTIYLAPGSTINIPQRKFLGVTDEAADMVAQLIAEELAKQIEEIP